MKSRERKTYQTRKEEHTSPCSPLGYHAKEQSNPKQKCIPPSPGANCPPNLDQLLKQNNQLRREVVELKFNQFYQFNDNKLKEMIKQLQQLRKQIKNLKGQLTQLQTQNNFLKVNNVHLKQQLQKQIQVRTKENMQEKHKTIKPNEVTLTTHITDSSRNTEDSISHLSNFSSNIHFIQNTTFQEVLKESHPSNDYQMVANSPRGEARNQLRQVTAKLDTREKKQLRLSRKSLMQKILSPRHGKQGSSRESRQNEYLIYRRREKGGNTKPQ